MTALCSQRHKVRENEHDFAMIPLSFCDANVTVEAGAETSHHFVR
jgi:hypothetical protein